MTYYHVDRLQTCQPNQTLGYKTLPEDCDPQIASYVKTHFPEGLSSIGYVYTAICKPSAEYQAYTAEILLELYRQKHFPTLPSRFQSICCTKTIKQAIVWFRELNLDRANLLTIQAHHTHTCDAAWRDLIAGNLSISHAETFCHNYWSGKPFENNPRPEVLAKLPVKIIASQDIHDLLNDSHPPTP